MEVPSRLALTASHLNVPERLQVPSVVKSEECFEKNSSLASLTMPESWLNALAQLGLSVLNQAGASHFLVLGGPPRVAFGVVLPIGMLPMESGEGCCLLGLGDCLGAGEGEGAVVGCSSMGEVFCCRMSGGNGGVCPNRR